MCGASKTLLYFLLQGWLSSYNQRAVLVRVLMNKRNSIQLPHDINQLKFFTVDSSTDTYYCNQTTDMEYKDFIDQINLTVPSFEFQEIMNDGWN